ncbi:MAG: hypothetical protein ACE5G1_10740 [bacterium]
MAQQKAKGSILYEILIVVLAAVLIGSIVYPKKVTEEEEANTELCRHRMSELFNGELKYIRYNKVYTDTASKVIEFLETDSTYAANVDSVIGGGLDSIITKLNEFKAIEQVILDEIPSALDTTMIDSISKRQISMKFEARNLAGFVEYIHDQMKSIPNTPIEDLRRAFLTVDSKEFTVNMDIVKNMVESGRLKEAEKASKGLIAVIDEVSTAFKGVLDRLPEFRSSTLDSLLYCPTVHKPYKLVSIDTSIVFKHLNIYCPIDSNDIQVAESSFLKSTLGGLKIENHGKIESGEKSWEESQ